MLMKVVRDRSRRKETKDKYNITHLFRTPNLRLKTVCICINWFVCGSCFFGLAQYMGYLDGNIFVNVAISGKFNGPVYLTRNCTF